MNDSTLTRDREAFIRAHTRLTPTPHAPSISLHVADEATALWEKTEEELGEMGLPPPFWAFAWAGGQALARYILDHPETVRGKRVFDVASGSGLVAIAAAQAGAASVIANEIDEFALAAIALNASVNGVRIAIEAGDKIGAAADADIICAGDVFYERDMATRIADWLSERVNAGALALVGDPGRSYLPKERLEHLASYMVPVTRALEDAEIKRASVWRFVR
ncbi:methyltransferase [Terrarubrum flagellatum]|uniref:class I SAM-dependent methyltransferase n=1 Tax=Terrirubrum flagellatum TaxID=2895980 RepID=UPI003144E14F